MGRSGVLVAIAVEILGHGLVDGAPDFSVEFRPELNVPGFSRFARDLPLIWLNDGAGHFSTLKVGDFVAAGREAPMFGSRPHLVATRNGYSLIATKFFPQNANGARGLAGS